MMRGLFGLVGLLVALAVVGLVVRKQMAAVQQPLPVLQAPADAASNASPALAQGNNAARQSELLQQQVKKAMDAAMQPRSMPDDK